mgnify:FL=1
MQTLQVGKGYVNVQRHFRGASILPKRGMVGNEVVTMAEGRPAPPDVVQGEHGGYYYFGNPLTPVVDPAHVDHLPEPHRSRALQQIAESAKKPLAPIKPTKDAERVKARAQKAAKPVKGRGIRNAKDLARETGGVTLERAQALIDKG